MEKALEIESNAYYDDGSEVDKEDEIQQLVGDLQDIGFDNREKVGPDDITFEIYRTSNQHAHEKSVTADVDIEIPEHLFNSDDRDFQGFEKELREKITEWQVETCQKLYRKLNVDYDSLTSEKEITDSLISNDYDFDINGNII